MQRVKEEVQLLKGKFEFLNCLETGTIRTYTEGHESTRHISEVIGENGHIKSLELIPAHIEVAKNICVNCCDNITWVECDSLDHLKNDDEEIYHFVLLDSVNDPVHIMEEFKLVANRMHEGGSIMVDDAGTDEQGNYTPNPNEQHQPKKGWHIWDWCKEKGVDAKIVTGGHSTQIMIPMTEGNMKIFSESL